MNRKKKKSLRGYLRLLSPFCSPGRKERGRRCGTSPNWNLEPFLSSLSLGGPRAESSKKPWTTVVGCTTTARIAFLPLLLILLYFATGNRGERKRKAYEQEKGEATSPRCLPPSFALAGLLAVERREPGLQKRGRKKNFAGKNGAVTRTPPPRQPLLHLPRTLRPRARGNKEGRKKRRKSSLGSSN